MLAGNAGGQSHLHAAGGGIRTSEDKCPSLYSSSLMFCDTVAQQARESWLAK
jgi:hypothetical protein